MAPKKPLPAYLDVLRVGAALTLLAMILVSVLAVVVFSDHAPWKAMTSAACIGFGAAAAAIVSAIVYLVSEYP